MSLVTQEPVVTASVVSGIIVSLASLFNVVIDPSTTTTVIAAVLPIILSLFARKKVTPVA